jgi:hypothetical protein
MPFSIQSYFEEFSPAGTGAAETVGVLVCAGVGRCTWAPLLMSMLPLK